MTQPRKNSLGRRSASGHPLRNRSELARRRLRLELLEPRFCLTSDIETSALLAPQSPIELSSTINWFATVAGTPRISPSTLAAVDAAMLTGVAEPNSAAVGEWIVRLQESAISPLKSLSQINPLLDRGPEKFTVLGGLGEQGLVLVRGTGASMADIEANLSNNPYITSFNLNQLIEGQSTTPIDSQYGLLKGLEKINAPIAWDTARGNLNTVVGVVDSGIDPTHPDLYLNIWLNQGEIPAELASQLKDIDNDGLITFYDLNNATRSTTAPYELTVNGFATGPNANFVRDLNNNNRIDAEDLLQDARWSDGVDSDNSGFPDDFFGVNFRAGSNDTLQINDPTDQASHGTHVAGTIAAVGSNSAGVTGVNWQTSLMSLRILDNNNQGDSAAAIRAINYARELRERLSITTVNRTVNGNVTKVDVTTNGSNVRVLNNSWGQPGGYEPALETAIATTNDAGILFVAAAGNGNLLGEGVDNDRIPYYPAGYESPNVIAVAASNLQDEPAVFSNFGQTSVDIFAPGVGIYSTLLANRYGSSNGTSMATPHVAGAAALIWSKFPQATVSEIRKAILNTAAQVPALQTFATSHGRLDVAAAITSDVFAPAAKITSKNDVTVAGGPSTDITIQYSHQSGIQLSSIDGDELLVTRSWGTRDLVKARLKNPPTIVPETSAVRATYVLTAPGGMWDVTDFGDYVISTVAGKASSTNGRPIEARTLGKFKVRIDDPNVFYVTTSNDPPIPTTTSAANLVNIGSLSAASSPPTTRLPPPQSS